VRIIHCSDAHLDSKLEANLSPTEAQGQRKLLLSQFSKLTENAVELGARAILIAGDLFDTENATLRSRDFVLDLARKNSDIDFLYLAGNHEKQGLFSNDAQIPSNFKIFGDEWQTVDYGAVTVSSAFMSEGVTDEFYSGLALSADKFNIVMLHGEISKKSGADLVNVCLLKNKNIDYIALGHYHTYSEIEIDKRTSCAYSGCLCGRGFDECGEKGYILLDIDEEKRRFTKTFTVLPSRILCEVSADISGLYKYSEIKQAVSDSLLNVAKENLVKVKLTGEQSPQSQRDLSQLKHDFKDKFYFIKFNDQTVAKHDLSEFINDISLRGEFIRLVYDDGALSDNEKRDILSYGYKALSGEEFSL